mmetsp:Transcript_30868/g.51078  ORF Transcript_30868/g.51078 Transcript_30868/m.51078 type:complete len:251 (-) Transcript_30868:454-1206(-)
MTNTWANHHEYDFFLPYVLASLTLHCAGHRLAHGACSPSAFLSCVNLHALRAFPNEAHLAVDTTASPIGGNIPPRGQGVSNSVRRFYAVKYRVGPKNDHATGKRLHAVPAAIGLIKEVQCPTVGGSPVRIGVDNRCQLALCVVAAAVKVCTVPCAATWEARKVRIGAQYKGLPQRRVYLCADKRKSCVERYQGGPLAQSGCVGHVYETVTTSVVTWVKSGCERAILVCQLASLHQRPQLAALVARDLVDM